MQYIPRFIAIAYSVDGSRSRIYLRWQQPAAQHCIDEGRLSSRKFADHHDFKALRQEFLPAPVDSRLKPPIAKFPGNLSQPFISHTKPISVLGILPDIQTNTLLLQPQVRVQ